MLADNGRSSILAVCVHIASIICMLILHTYTVHSQLELEERLSFVFHVFQ